MPPTMDVIKGALNVTIPDVDPVLPKVETATAREMPCDDTNLETKAESEIHTEFSDAESPTVKTQEIAAAPKIRPCTTVMTEPVNGNVTDDNELITGLLVENAYESKPKEPAETRTGNPLPTAEHKRLLTALSLTQIV